MSRRARGHGAADSRTPWQRVLRFLALFLGMIAVFQVGFVAVLADSSLFTGLLNLNARLSGEFLGWLGDPVTVDGDVLASPTYALQIKRGCDALQPFAILAAAVLAHPAPWGSKAWALGAGLAVLFVVNILRIISLYYLGVHFPRTFEVAHEAVWPAAFILLALAIWACWASRVTTGSPR